MLKETLLKFFKLDGLVNSLNEYIETRIELIKYELKDDFARVTSRIALILIMMLFFTLFIFLISISLAHALSQHVSIQGSYAIVASFYLLLIIVIFIFKKPINRLLEKEIKKILHKHDEHTGD
jgi:uncharacterized membrane protein YqjE